MPGQRLCSVCCNNSCRPGSRVCDDCDLGDTCYCGRRRVIGKHHCSYCIIKCFNCRRCARTGPSGTVATGTHGVYNVSVTERNVTLCMSHRRRSRRFDFLDLRTGQTRIPLCDCCASYLNATEPDNNDGEVVWPAFVWSVLRRVDIHREAWALVPSVWRHWWLREFAIRHGRQRSDLLEEKESFKDVSEDLKLDTDAIVELKWRGLMDRELSLTIPEVKCPAGCSEFKHKTQNLPLDLVWEELLQVPLNPMFTKKVDRGFTRIFRKDYLEEFPIVMNDNWMCGASIAKFGNGAPSVLSCRHHSKLSRKQMIHPSVNPTGPIASSRGGSISPVVPVPRTIQKARMSAFSASFLMAYMEGSYFGTDTMFLSSEQEVASVDSDLGWRQDEMTYANRRDVRAYMKRKFRSTWGFDGSVATMLAKSAADLYPFLDEIKAKFSLGASYVGLNDSVMMQKETDFGVPEIGWNKGADHRWRRIQFKGRYPKRVVWSHPAVSRSGCRPPTIPRFRGQHDFDARVPWLLSSMMLLVPEIWASIATVPNKKAWEWEGHLLTHLTEKHLTHLSPKSSGKNPFAKGQSMKRLLVDYMQEVAFPADGTFDMSCFARMLHATRARMPFVQIYPSSFPDVVRPETKTIIITRNYDANTVAGLHWEPPDTMRRDGNLWKLCYIAQTEPLENALLAGHWRAVAFSRHLDDDITHWWKSSRDYDLPVSASHEEMVSETSAWDACVYVRTKGYVPRELRDQVLASCGGQHKVYCRRHNYPLIIASTTDARKCCCLDGALPAFGHSDSLERDSRSVCVKKASFACVMDDCSSAICRNHQASVVEWSGKFFAGSDYCEYTQVQGDPNLDFDRDTEGLAKNLPMTMDEDLVHDAFDFEEGTAATTDVTDDECSDDGSVFIPEDDGEGFEALYRLRDNLDNDMLMVNIMQGTDDMEDITALLEEDVEAAVDGEVDLPTTNAGTLPVYSVTEGDYKGCTINNHVVLNSFGNMLIRRNSRITGTLNQRHFLQRMVARVPGDSLPLAYPEGMLFSNHFYTDTLDGTIIGALPAALLNSDDVLAEWGFASLEDHYRTRISNPSLLASSDPKYHLFALDCLVNLGLRGNDSRIIMRRGFAESQKAGGVRFKGSDDRIFDTEQVDSRATVNKLAAAINEDSPTYFYTHTCSMKTHFGLKLLWDWLDSDEILTKVCTGGESEREKKALRGDLVNGSGALLLRVWMETMHIWIAYITKSPEKPIGDVTDFLFRMELQDAKANLPHLHALLWTADDLGTEEGLEAAMDRIRGFVGDIVRPEERERYKEEGVFEDDAAVIRFMDMIQKFLVHHHKRRCFIPSTKQNEDGSRVDGEEMRCKANNNRRDNPTPGKHHVKTIRIPHSAEAIEVLQKLDLGDVDELGDFIPFLDCLKASKHYPPAHGDEGIISAVFGTLVARNPSMSNAQMATGYTLARYLAKYILSIDTYNAISIKPPKPKQSPDEFNVHGQELPNQKVTSNRIREKRRQRTEQGKQVKQRKGRAFNVAEFYLMLFGYDPVITSFDFVHVMSRSFDERAARKRMRPIDAIKNQYSNTQQHVALTPVNVIPAHHARVDINVAPWRQFRETQVEIILDDLYSPLSTSQVTIFSARPPELAFVAKHGNYRRWFTEEKQSGKITELIDWALDNTDGVVSRTAWIDGFSNQMKVRKAAVPHVIELLEKRELVWFQGYDAMLCLFRKLQVVCNSTELDGEGWNLLSMYISDFQKDKLPVIWYESVRPTRTNRFLIHLLLTMGNIRDEYDLFSCGTLRHSFIRCGLLDPHEPELSAKQLARDYVTEQLSRLPAGTNTFDQYLVAAYESISALFLYDHIETTDIPTVLYCHTVEETEEKILQHLKKSKLDLVRYVRAELLECGMSGIPSEVECMEATVQAPCQWDPTATQRHPDHPEESYEEQQRVVKTTMRLVQHYRSATPEFTKGICHIGAGGVGKTTVLLLETLYCITQGLNSAVTAMLSERAQELGGRHIHNMFCIQGRDGVLSPSQMCERAIAVLFRNPTKLEVLIRLDVLALDEAGAIPCEILAAMDHILRYVRNSNRPWGGVLIIATMDYLQIEPVSGRHPLMSPAFTTCMLFRELKHSVRAALDADWRRLQEITRLSVDELTNENTRAEFIELFSRICSFVYSLEDANIPANILYAFGKKKPIREQEKRRLKELMRDPTRRFITSTAVDEHRTVDGSFTPAPRPSSDELDKQSREQRELVFYEGGRYQITYNRDTDQGTFSNSQLAVMFDLPDQSVVDAKRPVTLVVAPAGCKFIPDITVQKAELLEMGWREMKVGTPTRDVVNVNGGTRAKRTQYGLRPHVGSTIHGVMGQTIASLLTRVDRGDKAVDYSVWMPAMVVVLLSRTRFARQTFFWVKEGTSPETVAETLYDVLSKPSRFRRHLTRVLKQLCYDGTGVSPSPYSISHATSVFRVKDIALPVHRLGYVYLLLSSRDCRTIYIGSASDLLRRFELHNSGAATKQTAPVKYRPWAILAYIVGFDSNKAKYTQVERNWILAKNELVRQGTSIMEIANQGKDIVARHNENTGDSLQYVSCGTIERMTRT